MQYTEEGKQGACRCRLVRQWNPHDHVIIGPSLTPLCSLGNRGSANRERRRHGPLLLDAVAAGGHGASSVVCHVPPPYFFSNDSFIGRIQSNTRKVYVEVPAGKTGAKDVKCEWGADWIELSVRGRCAFVH